MIVFSLLEIPNPCDVVACADIGLVVWKIEERIERQMLPFASTMGDPVFFSRYNINFNSDIRVHPKVPNIYDVLLFAQYRFVQ